MACGHRDAPSLLLSLFFFLIYYIFPIVFLGPLKLKGLALQDRRQTEKKSDAWQSHRSRYTALAVVDKISLLFFTRSLFFFSLIKKKGTDISSIALFYFLLLIKKEHLSFFIRDAQKNKRACKARSSISNKKREMLHRKK